MRAADLLSGAVPSRERLLDLLAAAWYVALTAANLWPIIVGLDSVVPHSIRDPGFQATVLHDVSERLLHLDFTHLFDASFFYPAHLTLALADAQLGLQPLALPLHLIFNDALLVLNILVILSFLLTALVGDVLGRYLTGARIGGLIIGTAFAFSAYRFEHIIHLQLLQSWTIALAYLGLEMTLQEDRRRGPALWAFALVAAAYTSLNYLPLIGITQPIYVAIRFAFQRPRRDLLLRLRRLFVPAVVAGCLIAIVVVPYVVLAARGYHRSLADTFQFSARPGDYLIPAADNTTLHALFTLHPPSTGIDERELLPGLIVLALAALGLLVPVLRRRSAFLQKQAPWLGVAAVAFLFSFGPYLWPDTQTPPPSGDGLIALPYKYLARPLLLESLRSPARFGVVVLLAVAVVAGLTASRAIPKLRFGWLRSTAVVLLAVGMAIEYRVSVPVQPVPWGQTLPPVYAWLRTQEVAPVVELPAVGVQVSYYLLASTVDGHPRLNGWSGFVPTELAPISRAVSAASLPGWLAAAQSLGAQYVIVHADQIDAATLAAAHAERDGGSLTLVAQFGSDEVYRLGPGSYSLSLAASGLWAEPAASRSPEPRLLAAPSGQRVGAAATIMLWR